MLGLADRARIFDLFEALVGGKVPESLDIVADLYAAGADPAVMVQDLLELAHFLTRAKLVPQSLESPGLPETERSEEHTSELQSLMRISYAVFCLKKKNKP